MALVLEIIDQQSLAMSEGVRKSFGKQGGSIGRAASNDWVLPDPERFISSSHALVSYQSGAFYITDTSTNGVFMNASDQALGNGTSTVLKTGDHIQIGEYDISVTVNDEAMDEPDDIAMGGETDWLSATDAQADKAEPHTPAAGEFSFNQSSSTPWHAVPAAEVKDKGLFDAYEASVSGDLPESGEAMAKPVVADDLPAVSASFKAPGTEADPGFIPVDWDKTDFGVTSDPGPDPATHQAPIPAETESEALQAKAAPQPEPESEPEPAPVVEAKPQSQPSQPAPRKARSQQPDHPATPEPAAPVEPQPVEVQPAEPQAAKTAPANDQTEQLDDALFQAFCAGLGIAPESVANRDKAAVMQQFGGVLRLITQGLMTVLLARGEIKGQFRMSQTRMRAAENNPLKLFPEVDMALNTMLAQPNRSYLPLSDAYNQAFADIQSHELAVLAGMRAAFAKVLDRFDPDALEPLFERKEKSTMFGNKKARHWETYKDYFADLKAEVSNEGVDCLLGDEFARAYERHVNSVKAGAEPS